MPKYLIKYDAGFGEESRVHECETKDDAEKLAYEEWREVAESNASYSAELLTKENAEEFGYEDEFTE